MYLDSLEASFVQQLYHSMHAGGMAMKMNSPTPFSSDKVYQLFYAPPQLMFFFALVITLNCCLPCYIFQLTRLGDERQKKINCGTSETVSDSTADSRAAFESLRFPHRSNTSKCHSVVSPDAQEHTSVRNSGSHFRGKLKRLYESTRSLNHRDLVCSTEGNFSILLFLKIV